MIPAVYNLGKVLRGDTINARQFTLCQKIGNTLEPLDLNDAQLRCTFKNNVQERLYLTLGAGLTLVDGTGGKFRLEPFSLPVSGKWRYDIEITFPTGVIKTYLQGEIEVLADITQ